MKLAHLLIAALLGGCLGWLVATHLYLPGWNRDGKDSLYTLALSIQFLCVAYSFRDRPKFVLCCIAGAFLGALVVSLWIAPFGSGREVDRTKEVFSLSTQPFGFARLLYILAGSTAGYVLAALIAACRSYWSRRPTP